MVAIALAWVLVPLLRRGTPGIAREASNVAILRDQLRELDADLAAGTMPRDRYEQAKRELEAAGDRGVARGPRRRGSRPSQSAAWTAAILGSAIPIAALLLYVVAGQSRGVRADRGATCARRAPSTRSRDRRSRRWRQSSRRGWRSEPDNVDGWVMLARTYYALDRHADAARAFDRAVALLPDNADLLADYADSLGAAEGGLRGKSLELIERALKADPTHWKALALAGTAAFNRKDYKSAVAYWERMKATVPPALSHRRIDRLPASPRRASWAASRQVRWPQIRPRRSRRRRHPRALPPATQAAALPGATIAGTVSARARARGQSVADGHGLHFRARESTARGCRSPFSGNR